MVRLATMVRLDLTGRMVHEECVDLLRPTVPQVQPRLMAQRVLTDRLTLQAVDYLAGLQAAAYHAGQLVALTDPQVHTDLTHPLDLADGSFCRGVQFGSSAMKLELRKRHLVTGNSG